MDAANGDKTAIKLETGDLRPVKTNSVLPANELEDGIYVWGVHFFGETDNKKGIGYFVVIGAVQADK